MQSITLYFKVKKTHLLLNLNNLGAKDGPIGWNGLTVKCYPELGICCFYERLRTKPVPDLYVHAQPGRVLGHNFPTAPATAVLCSGAINAETNRSCHKP